MEYKVVEAWAAMSYYSPEEHKTLYEDTEDSLQCFWVVSYDPDEEEIIEWVEMFSEEEEAEEYKKKLEQE